VLNLSSEALTYRRGIVGLGTIPERMAAEYSTARRITPTRVRVY
jgi:hypothetical protein